MVLGLIASRRKAENTKKGIIETISASRITKRDREHMITIDDGFLLYLSEKSTGKKIKRRKREKKRRENKQSDAVFEIRQGILKHFVLDVANDLGRALPSSSSFETFMGWHDTKVYYCRTNCGLGNLNVIKISVPFDHFPAFSPTQIASSFYDENFTDLGQIKSPLMIFSATTVQKWRIRNLFKTAKVDTSIFTLASLDGLHFFTVNYNKENSINNNSNSYREQSFEIVETDWTASSSARFSVRIIRPGDIIVGDQDGVVVVPAAVATTVEKIARGREEIEVIVKEELTKNPGPTWNVLPFLSGRFSAWEAKFEGKKDW
ncbi:hypothetical protein ScalyP_jg11842 [Parmales sp. scaly parma]|nr:hypothetical protein ScalyP_jg11842 [Parmales sp. scaly parma]